jgi:hypothetical protein
MAYTTKGLLVVGFLLSSLAALATVFGSVTGIIHDPHHRPVQGATVSLKAKSSDWSAVATSNANGQYRFIAVPA